MTSRSDKATNTVVANGINATLSGTTPAKGNIISTDDFNHITFAYFTGTVTDAGTASGFAVEIQESVDTADANFTAVADAHLTALESTLTVTSDAADNDAIGTIGYLGTLPYVRAVVTGTTGTNAVVIGVWLKQRSQYAPPSSNVAADVAAT